ncbi:MAG TPA: ATP-binding protein [Pirellulales bacterium]|jgi:signal transduction histidine kinase|nr:ATP-binding protein [Pirellulales bacterium]
MSYRSLKRVLGETSLERKCLFLFGICLLTLITGGFWWYSSQTDDLVLDATRRTASGLKGTILVREHLRELTIPQDLARNEILYRELGDEAIKHDWRFLRPHLDNQALDETEAKMLEEFVNPPPDNRGWDEARAHDNYRYFLPIRATDDKCVSCHRIDRPDQVGLELGGLIAVMEITIPDRETQQDQTYNRAILMATAIVTVFFSMVAVYFILRYVVVKPLGHLREVSDEISRGNTSLRAEIHTGDEFENLALAFNRMLRHLTTIQEELRNANTNLNGKVDELAQVNMQLYEMNRLKSEFLAMMSHELRTPLNAIIGFSDVLDSIASLDEKQKRYVKNIQTSGKVLLEMINDILDLAKIESGNMEVRLSDFRIDAIIHGVSDTYLQATERKNIDLKADVEPGLPEMYQDQVKVQQILTNLLSNAIKFTPEGGRITISAGRDSDDYLVMKVADTGVGIATEDQTVIFEKFRQGTAVFSGGDALTREYSGTGLGLSIVKELCKLLGGEVSLESQLGKGSTFSVRLPWNRRQQPKVESPLATALEGLAKNRRSTDHPRGTDQPIGATTH